MTRRILWAMLALAPVAILGRFVFGLDETTLFVVAALALIPLAFIIGEATEHAAEHTGPGVGGFLNASFGNAPELIIALIAIANNLPGVVRGSLTGSIVSNMLLVLGAAMFAGGEGAVDTRSLRVQLFAVLGAVALFAIPSVFSWDGGSHERRSLYIGSIPVSVLLLVAYAVITVRNLRIHRAAERSAPAQSAWSLKRSILTLGVATIATALVSEVLVHSLEHFGHAVGLNEFFIAVVIVAIVGNAAEHGGAVVIAHRGNKELATEIAVTSSMQVALFVTPLVCLLSWVAGRGLPLSFRAIEIGTMFVSAALAMWFIWDGRAERKEGVMLVAAYCVMVGLYFVAS